MGMPRTIKIVLTAVTLSAALCGGGVRAADEGVRRIVLTPSDTPYPAEARAMNLPGRVVLGCTAAASGAVHDCSVQGEDPPDWGFGQAAMLAAAAFNVGAGDEGRQVQVPVGFNLQPDEVGPDPAVKTPGFFIADDQIQWLQQPTVNDFVLSYPPNAVKQDIEGFAAVACRVTADGRLEACAVISEQPRGQGFDKAALEMASKYRMAPKLADGRPAAGGVMRKGFGWSLH